MGLDRFRPAEIDEPMEPMDQGSAGRPDAVAPERLERPTSHLRSPVVDDRLIELLPPDPDRPSLEIPSARELVGLLTWVIVPAIPVLLLVGWQAALIALAVAGLFRWLNGRAGRTNSVFADGFLQFRGDGARAQGIQEEDDVHWTWSGGPATGAREDSARPSWPGSINP